MEYLQRREDVIIRKTGVSTGSSGKCDCFIFWKCNRIGQWKKNLNRKRYRRKSEGLNSELPGEVRLQI